MSENNVLVIFGATGDLTYQKLLPSLASLIQQQPDALSKIVLIGRQGKTLQDYFQYGVDRGLDEASLQPIISRLEYVYLQATEAQSYHALTTVLAPFATRIFYLATPPTMFHVITDALHHHGLYQKANPLHRIAYEKPFGDNTSTAEVLNQLLHENLEEHQLYRVDHYLAKPLIQQLIKVRMQWATVGMESLWTSAHIASIDILAYETVSILARGKFYDATGALKDMVQSHLLETLALLCMDLPNRIDDIATIQQAKVNFLRSLNPNLQQVVLGQYEGYRQEMHVNPSSTTETFVSLPLQSTLPRWQQTNISIRTGKKLEEKRTEIRIKWRNGGTFVFQISPQVGVHYNDVFLTNLTPTQQQHLQALQHHPFRKQEAYTTVFADLIAGNQTLFPSSKEIMATWHIIDQVKQVPVIPTPYQTSRDLGLPLEDL